MLRRQRQTCVEIARTVGVSRATVARIVGRCGGARLHVLELPPTSRRYERAVAGELVHLDTKKLGRIVRPSHSVMGDRRDRDAGADGQRLVLQVSPFWRRVSAARPAAFAHATLHASHQRQG